MIFMRIPGASALKRLDLHMKEVLRGASIALGIKLLAAGLGFFSNVLLARILGPEGAGLYFLAFTVITIGSVLGRVGLDNTLLRFTAANASDSDWHAVKGVSRMGIILAFGTSCATVVIIFLIAPMLAERVFSDVRLANLIRWMVFALIPVSLLTLYAQLLRGIGSIGNAMMVLSACVPAFFTIGLLFLAPTYGALGAVWAYTGAAILSLFIGIFLWHRSTPQLRGIRGHFDTKKLLDSSIPLLWVSCAQLVMQWSANCVLGMWRTSGEVGVFAVANRTALLTSLILVAVNSISGPKFATLHRQGDMEGLGRLARNSSKLMSLLVSPVVLPLLVVPHWVMSLFGPQFGVGGPALAIIAAGQFVNVAAGSVQPLLMMCGHERLMRNNFVCSAIICMILNLSLIPPLGVLGAALAFAVTLVFQNLVAVTLVWRRLGIMTIPGISFYSGHTEGLTGK